MASAQIPWNSGTWTNRPRSVREISTKDGDGTAMVVEALESSDYWEKTLYGFQHDSGHGLLAGWDTSTAVEVTVELSALTELYDQAGLLLWSTPTQWIKAGVEITDGIPHLGAVVTDGYSDWSLAPVPEWAGAVVTIRASHQNDAVIIRARVEGRPWRTIRVARFAAGSVDGVKAGPFTCAPTRCGLEVTFTRWRTTAPDQDLHTDPPLG